MLTGRVVVARNLRVGAGDAVRFRAFVASTATSFHVACVHVVAIIVLGSQECVVVLGSGAEG